MSIFSAMMLAIKFAGGRALSFAQTIPSAVWKWIALAAALAAFGWAFHSMGYKKSESAHAVATALAQKVVAEANAAALFTHAKAQADAIDAEARHAAAFSASKAAYAAKSRTLESKLAAAQAKAGRSPSTCDSPPEVVDALNELIKAANERATPKEASK